MNDFTQSPVLFGPAHSLLGMLTTPGAGATAPVACLLLNMGANHRVGPHRINVKLAHQLAECGLASLRFDLGGLGDSASAGHAEHFSSQAVLDVQAAMDLLQVTLGVHQFLIVGLCSGAVNALAAAVADARVIGISMFDGYTFPDRRSRWARNLWRALAAPTHPAFVGKLMRQLQRRFQPARALDGKADLFADEVPAHVKAAMFRRSMAQLAERGVAVHTLYSGTLHVRDRHRDQLGRFRHEPFAQALRYEFIRELDHTLTTLEAQRLFLASVSDWALDVVAARAARWASPPAHHAPAAMPPSARPTQPSALAH